MSLLFDTIIKMVRRLKKTKKTSFFLTFSLIASVVLLVLISLINLNTKKKITTNSQAIQGGNLVSTDAYPFVVAIFDATRFRQNLITGKTNLYDITGQVTECTGSLISTQYVLTAAHCVVEFKDDGSGTFFPSDQSKKPNKIGIAIGFRDLQNDTVDNQNRIIVYGKEIKQNFVPNPGDSHLNTKNDIALIKLNRPVDINKFKPISYIRDVTLNNSIKNVLTIGYGSATEESDPPHYLRSLFLEIGVKEIINNHLFARGYQKSILGGDSGGPLVIWKNNKWNLIGVAKTHIGSSKGSGVDYEWIRDYVDSVFTDVSSYTEWIKDNSGVDVNQGTFIGIPPPTLTKINMR